MVRRKEKWKRENGRKSKSREVMKQEESDRGGLSGKLKCRKGKEEGKRRREMKMGKEWR
jgi:hypothetical protein